MRRTITDSWCAVKVIDPENLGDLPEILQRVNSNPSRTYKKKILNFTYYILFLGVGKQKKKVINISKRFGHKGRVEGKFKCIVYLTALIVYAKSWDGL